MTNKKKHYLFMIFLVALSILMIIPQILLLFVRIFKKKEKLERLHERLAICNNGKLQKPIWIHAASVGETIVAFTLIELLSQKNPTEEFLLTTGTISSANLTDKKFPEIRQKYPKVKVIHKFLPVDNFFVSKKFIKYWDPKIILFIESELWPNILFSIKDETKTLLVNARMSPRSYKKWSRLSWFIAAISSRIDNVLAQSPIDTEHFKNLGFSNVELIGNLKYVQNEEKLDLEFLNLLKKGIGHRKILFAASTHAPEEEIIIRIFLKLRKDLSDLILIIAPRHPSRVNDILSIPYIKNMNIVRRNFVEDITSNTDIFILDSFGEMSYIFSLHPITFMGGTFSIGGHNILEPAKYLSPIIFGPNMTNFAEISEEFLRKKAAIQAADEEDLYQKLALMLGSSSSENQKIIEAAKSIIESKQEVGKKYIESINLSN